MGRVGHGWQWIMRPSVEGALIVGRTTTQQPQHARTGHASVDGAPKLHYVFFVNIAVENLRICHVC